MIIATYPTHLLHGTIIARYLCVISPSSERLRNRLLERHSLACKPQCRKDGFVELATNGSDVRWSTDKDVHQNSRCTPAIR